MTSFPIQVPTIAAAVAASTHGDTILLADGVFTVEEQEIAFGQAYESNFGSDVRFKTSDQLFRLGLRIAF